MAGASNYERIDATVVESTVGTTPATPAFQKVPFDVLNMTGNPRISEARLIAFQGQRSGILRNGIAVAGSARGKLIYGVYDTFLESMFQASYSTDVLVNAYDQIAFTVEQSIPEGVGGTRAYTRFRACEIVSGTLTLTAGQDAEFNFDIIGSASDDADTTAITGATYADPASTDFLGSGSDIGTIAFGGITLTQCLQSATIDFGVEDKTEQLRISSDGACGINRGVMRPVVTLRAYIEPGFVTAYNTARNGGTTPSLTLPIGSTSGQKYTIEFPKCELIEAPLETAESGPAFQPIRIMPLYDTGIGGTCRVTRAVT